MFKGKFIAVNAYVKKKHLIFSTLKHWEKSKLNLKQAERENNVYSKKLIK